jgi:monofunctional biosynthetic peptidoglycan transglycosylase
MAKLSSVRPGRRPARRRRSPLRRVFRGVFFAAVLLALLPVGLLPLYAIVDPPITTVMAWKRFLGAPIDKEWAPLERISPHLVRAVVTSEDARFCSHRGIDLIELRNALADDDGRRRGASTLTMQTVKNLFLWTGRDYFRKGLEALLALYADALLSKRRILEIYLNVAEWGDGVYGAEAAARHQFGISAIDLTASQAALLAAVLPAPRARSAGRPSEAVRRIAGRIAARAERGGADLGCVIG